MWNPRKISVLFIFGIGLICCYYWKNLPVSSSSPSTTMYFALPSEKYKVVEMNDRIPSFKLASDSSRKPYADGDRAQATVLNSLQLVNRCKQDPSLIVVDVGGFLGI